MHGMGRGIRILGFLVLAGAVDALAATGTTTQLSTGSATDQQNSPAISGTDVVWTDVKTSSGVSNFDIYLYDVAGSGAPINLTNTPNEQEFLEDIDGSYVVWTRTSSGVPGDIILYDIAMQRAATVASSTSWIYFEQPAVRGHWLTFLQATSTQVDVDLYDINTAAAYHITNDAATQGRPRVGGDYVVYEDYGSGNADVYGWQISTNGPSFAIATGANPQMTPDIDGNTVVYVETLNGHDQLFAYDLTTKQARQLTSAPSAKILPRISGSRIVWSDDRNGNLDLYYYDLSTSTEAPLVTGAGDQFLSDIDGNRVVYTDNASGFQQVWMFTFSTVTPPPPPTLPEGCDPDKTDLVGKQTVMTRASYRPVYAKGSFAAEPGRTYYVCVENGDPSGKERTTQFVFSVDTRIELTPTNFRPLTNPPRWVTADLGLRKAFLMRRPGMSGSWVTQHDWSAALFGMLTPTRVTVSIRVLK
jgi:TolB protein